MNSKLIRKSNCKIKGCVNQTSNKGGICIKCLDNPELAEKLNKMSDRHMIVGRPSTNNRKPKPPSKMEMKKVKLTRRKNGNLRDSSINMKDKPHHREGCNGIIRAGTGHKGAERKYSDDYIREVGMFYHSCRLFTIGPPGRNSTRTTAKHFDIPEPTVYYLLNQYRILIMKAKELPRE